MEEVLLCANLSPIRRDVLIYYLSKGSDYETYTRKCKELSSFKRELKTGKKDIRNERQQLTIHNRKINNNRRTFLINKKKTISELETSIRSTSACISLILDGIMAYTSNNTDLVYHHSVFFTIHGQFYYVNNDRS